MLAQDGHGALVSAGKNPVSLAHSGRREPARRPDLRSHVFPANAEIPGYGFTMAIDDVERGMRITNGKSVTGFPFSTRCAISSARFVSPTNMNRPLLSKTASWGPPFAERDKSPAHGDVPAESVWRSEPVSIPTLKAVISVPLATNNVSRTDDNDRAGALTVNGDPGTAVREPSLLILNPVIRGALESPRKRNCKGTVAPIGVGVGVGVGVGETVGVGVGDGFSFTTRRGEITQPAMSRNNRRSTTKAIANWFGWQGKCRILEGMPGHAGLLPPVICAVFTAM